MNIRDFLSKKIVKRVLIGGAALVALVVALIVGCYIYVESVSSGKTYDDIDSIPKNRVGVVLGTNPIARQSGRPNAYYTQRIKATVALYNAGKIERILISGDNGHKEYSEPDAMKADLVAAGIPAEHIYLDFAGFRTLDTMVRAKKVFGLTEFTIISQEFHNERAICLGEWQGISVIGFNAGDASIRFGYKTHIRESFSRVKMVYDMITDKQPHFLGEQIVVE